MIANSYPMRMRGDAKRELRRANLLALRERFTLEVIARRSGTSAVYLSQIANAVTRQGGKRPRSLSDDYAEKIERGLGLEPGWMDQPHGRDAPAGTAVAACISGGPIQEPPRPPALTFTPDELELVLLYNRLTPAQQDTLKAFLATLTRQDTKDSR